MALVKTSITISEDILNQAKNLSENFSAVVAEALKEYIRRKSIEKAIGSFGKWEDREKDSVSLINEMRSEGNREYANRNN